MRLPCCHHSMQRQGVTQAVWFPGGHQPTAGCTVGLLARSSSSTAVWVSGVLHRSVRSGLTRTSLCMKNNFRVSKTGVLQRHVHRKYLSVQRYLGLRQASGWAIQGHSPGAPDQVSHQYIFAPLSFSTPTA